MNNHSHFNRILSGALILLFLLVALFSGWKIVDILSKSQHVDFEESTPSKTIVRNGVEYFPRQDITVLMLLGIDETGIVTPSESYNNTGESDVVTLAIFDEKAKTYSVLVLNRDTMMDIPVLGVGGKPAGSIYGQLALSHTYGSGMEDSCENTRKAVSDFLYGINIDYYLSMNMDAISKFTDEVGGVTVQVKDDFSQVDPTIPMGTVRLNGDQALNFIRSRSVGNLMNTNRMERHKEYMVGFMDALIHKVHASGTFMLNLYDAMSEYMVTDCSATTLNSLVSRYADYTMKEVLSPDGNNVRGDEFMEFYPDEEALDQMILNLFYAEKNHKIS